MSSKYQKRQLKELVDQKVEKLREDLQQENKELRNEIKQLKKQKERGKNANSGRNISRREFLKKASLGTAGLAALMTPASALNIKSDSLNFSDNNNEYLDINEGIVNIKNADLQIIDGNIGIGIDNPDLPLEVGGSRGIRIPTGNNDQRSNSPKEGEFRINSEKSQAEVYFSGEWKNIGSIFVPIDAEGGTTVTDEVVDGRTYRIHAFEDAGADEFSVNDTGSDGKIDVLVVGGGGAGGIDAGGGGGAGGLVYKEEYKVDSGNYGLTVGEGGTNGPQVHYDDTDEEDEPFEGRAHPGEDSKFDNLLALGGGGGVVGNSGQPGMDGGSGGGGSQTSDSPGGEALQPGTNPSADLDLGSDGGPAGFDGGNAGGGGGGASSAGDENYNSDQGGDGGDGTYMGDKFTEKFGEKGYFAGGGGGSNNDTTEGGSPGIGGGGSGSLREDDDGDTTLVAGSGKPNTGGGGGAGDNNVTSTTGDGHPYYEFDNNHSHSASGGSGIVLIRYPLEKIE